LCFCLGFFSFVNCLSNGNFESSSVATWAVGCPSQWTCNGGVAAIAKVRTLHSLLAFLLRSLTSILWRLQYGIPNWRADVNVNSATSGGVYFAVVQGSGSYFQRSLATTPNVPFYVQFAARFRGQGTFGDPGDPGPIQIKVRCGIVSFTACICTHQLTAIDPLLVTSISKGVLRRFARENYHN
jgi:hypothetical protein